METKHKKLLNTSKQSNQSNHSNRSNQSNELHKIKEDEYEIYEEDEDNIYVEDLDEDVLNNISKEVNDVLMIFLKKYEHMNNSTYRPVLIKIIEMTIKYVENPTNDINYYIRFIESSINKENN